ncbi:hypothetical protein C8Q80DRAFT_339851 [Daedaleopsis nitida]|nr:hypothetical protein C8Q80DRAFT_339851 [Daedaleopsis nitida]
MGESEARERKHYKRIAIFDWSRLPVASESRFAAGPSCAALDSPVVSYINGLTSEMVIVLSGTNPALWNHKMTKAIMAKMPLAETSATSMTIEDVALEDSICLAEICVKISFIQTMRLVRLRWSPGSMVTADPKAGNRHPPQIKTRRMDIASDPSQIRTAFYSSMAKKRKLNQSRSARWWSILTFRESSTTHTCWPMLATYTMA